MSRQEKITKPTFILPAKQSKHLILFPNNCADSRARVTRNLVEQKFSVPLRGEQMGHVTAGATASKIFRTRESHCDCPGMKVTSQRGNETGALSGGSEGKEL